MDDKLQHILNRRPSRWRNVTIKEFERDIKLLTKTVKELSEEVEYWKGQTDKHLSFYINQTLKQHEEGKNDQRN